MEKIHELDTKFFKQIKKVRNDLKNDRKNFWNKNRVNFQNNIKNLVSDFTFPKGWNVNIIASRFLLDKPVMPYDKDVWSFSDVVAATENMGYEIIIFFNKTDLEFLSAPALLPIIVHEVKHVFQAAEKPKEYINSTVDEALNKSYEKDADAEVRKYSDEFRRENVLEKIMFCYDEEGWKGAKKMVQYLYEEAENAFGGGYDQELKKNEYEVFNEAVEEKDIDIFVDHFIDSLKILEDIRKAEEKKQEDIKEKKADEAKPVQNKIEQIKERQTELGKEKK